jgi:two-component system phosphate regulon sensor histidine kinase PhoR
MGWVLQRLAAVAVIVFIGAFAGATLGHASGWPVLATVAGAVLAAAVAAGLERRKGLRLLDWVRGAVPGPAPRDGGYWAELAYRIEKALQGRERAAAAEREQYRQFLQAIEASPNGVLLLDARDQLEWCNSVAADHFGLDPLRDRLQRLTNLVRAPAFVLHLQEARFDEPVVFPAPGARGTLSVLVRPYGEARKLVLSSDITERERSDTMRRDFVANVSHEIRTPLTVLAGFVETLSTLELSEGERRRVLTLMAQQTGRMQALVADLLTLAQLEGEALALSGGRHELVFEQDVAAEAAGSASELQSALSNLVSNAVRYTPEGGRIQVRWQERADGGGELEVQDSGIGIAREHLPRLTERFYRVDPGRARDSGGTGLGLAIVKHVAQRHGGEIDIQSEAGSGSRFRVVLPAFRVRHSGSSEPPLAGVALDREAA